jgi:cystathionine beta-lyase/cystathionine gamma-synthase
MLEGEAAGYVYSRDGHPNADMLAEQCRKLHRAERAALVATGMGALAVIVLAELQQGDHIVVSHQLYGASLDLLVGEAARMGITTTVVDTSDLAATQAALIERTRLLVVESISNPLLRVADVAELAELAHGAGARLVVDNSFASPALFRPIEHGADWVMESVTKMMSGHSDVVLGMVCGREELFARVPRVLSRWGLASSPFDCWLALRGLATMDLRAGKASQNAQQAAEFLDSRREVAWVAYPGLPDHADHELARRQFGGRFGSMVTYSLHGGRSAAESFIQAARRIAFCPSLGEFSTTLSHPESTSHRSLSPAEQASLGIDGGTIRLSVGIESAEAICDALAEGLAGVG